MINISLPISDEVAKLCVLVADAFEVEPWEIAAHVALTSESIKRRKTEKLKWIGYGYFIGEPK